MEPLRPLILSLSLDETTQAFFDEQRQAYFPRERNYLGAHLTLFHHLPAGREEALRSEMARLCAEQAPLPLTVSGLMFLGRGVAYAVENDALRALHQTLQVRWSIDLTPQDQRALRPHITVQNKVPALTARALYQQLAADFTPFAATGSGLALWAYCNGPWEPVDAWTFRGAV